MSGVPQLVTGVQVERPAWTYYMGDALYRYRRIEATQAGLDICEWQGCRIHFLFLSDQSERGRAVVRF